MARPPLGYGKENFFVERGHKLTGVIHVGANDGEEITWYLHVGRTPVLAFEPQADMYLQALENYEPEINQGLVRLEALALGESNEIITLTTAANNGEWDTKGTSALGPVPPGSALAMGWIPPHTTREEQALCRRFDDWVDEHHVDLSPYNVLVVDVQGMELPVLKGFGKYLRSLPFLMVECSERPIWNGEASAQDVSDWLAGQGYQRLTPIVSHNDVMFILEGM